MGKKRGAKKEKKREENGINWKDKYLRALADYQNLEKRVFKLQSKVEYQATKRVIKKFLPILDELERAEKNIKNKGLRLIIEKIINLLKNEGVEKYEVLGKDFDPEIMECVDVKQTGEKKDGKVVEEVTSGYKINNEAIRVASVKVGKGK